ncbi:MAG TPA: PAS domain-containing protein, partial [Prolixibacteraceae bacterium]|nr:PAS domain-containing protein [Prolixibacteraceae bacterium]
MGEIPFSTLFDPMPEGCIVVDRTLNIVYLNDAARRLFNNREPCLTGSLLIRLHQSVESNKTFLSLLQSENLPQKTEIVLSSAGRKRWIGITLSPLPEGILILASDQTALKKTEKQLRKKKEQNQQSIVELEAVINALPGIVSVVDTHFRVLHANEAAYKQFGQNSLGEILGKTCYSVRKGLKNPCPQCNLIKAFTDGEPKIRVSTPEEEKMMGIATKAFAVPLFDKKGKIWG